MIDCRLPLQSRWYRNNILWWRFSMILKAEDKVSKNWHYYSSGVVDQPSIKKSKCQYYVRDIERVKLILRLTIDDLHIHSPRFKQLLSGIRRPVISIFRGIRCNVVQTLWIAWYIGIRLDVAVINACTSVQYKRPSLSAYIPIYRHQLSQTNTYVSNYNVNCFGN
jgi:hypothetical protein